MYVLYVFAVLFFMGSYIFFKTGKIIIGNWLMTIALFLNPLGYDIVVYGINMITHDYWVTISFMYVLAGIFFLMFIYLYNINPIKAFSYHAKNTHNIIKKKVKSHG